MDGRGYKGPLAPFYLTGAMPQGDRTGEARSSHGVLVFVAKFSAPQAGSAYKIKTKEALQGVLVIVMKFSPARLASRLPMPDTGGQVQGEAGGSLLREGNSLECSML